jgi:hypothetical protein
MQVNMKMKTMLLGLTPRLFPLPLQAMPVHVALVSEDLIGDLQNLESVDVAIETFDVGFNGVFPTPHTTSGAGRRFSRCKTVATQFGCRIKIFQEIERSPVIKPLSYTKLSVRRIGTRIAAH